MAKQTVAQLKAWFRKGLKPTEEQFAALLESYLHKDDEIDINKVKGLIVLLNKKYDGAQGEALQQKIAELGEWCQELDEYVAQSESAQQKEIDALKSAAIREFAGVVYHESEASGRTVGEIYYAAAEGYFVEVTEAGVVKAPYPYNNSDSIGAEYWGNKGLLYRVGTDLYKLTESGAMVKYALVTELTGGSGDVDLSGYLTIEEAEQTYQTEGDVNVKIEELKGGDLSFKTLKDMEETIFDESDKLAELWNIVSGIDTTGIKVVGSETEIEDMDNGQLVGVYAPDTRYSGKRLTEVGMAVADEEGYLINAAGATAVNKITFADGLNVDDEIEIVFSCKSDELLKQVFTLSGGVATVSLWHKTAGELDYQEISGTHYFGYDYYLVSYRRTGGDVTATASNYSAWVDEINAWLGDVVELSGGQAETLTHYTKTSKGLVEFAPMKVWRTEWRYFGSEDIAEYLLSAEEYQRLSEANLVIVDGSVASKGMSEDMIWLNDITYVMGNAITTRSYSVTLQEDGTGKVSVTSQSSIEIPTERWALQSVMELVELSQMEIDVNKPFFVDVTLGKAYYTEGDIQNDLGGISLYMSQGENHPQMAEIWHYIASCNTEGRTRVKCEPLITGLWEVTVVNDNGEERKRWLDLSWVTHIGLMSYMLDTSGYQMPFVADEVSMKIYR